MKGWGGVQGIKQLSQQSSSSSLCVGLLSPCKLSALHTLLSKFSRLPRGARRRQGWLEMRKQAWQKDNCLAWHHAAGRNARPKIGLPNSESIGSRSDHQGNEVRMLCVSVGSRTCWWQDSLPACSGPFQIWVLILCSILLRWLWALPLGMSQWWPLPCPLIVSLGCSCDGNLEVIQPNPLVLWMKKLRPREMKWLPKGHTDSKGWARSRTQLAQPLPAQDYSSSPRKVPNNGFASSPLSSCL